MGVVPRFDVDAASLWWQFTPWEVRSCFEVKPLQAWYYCISPNFRTLVILLKVDPISSDELKTIYKGFYEIEDILIFAWFLNPTIGHYCWLHNLICWLPPNNKVYYLIRTIRRILNFLHIYELPLWHTLGLNMYLQLLFEFSHNFPFQVQKIF